MGKIIVHKNFTDVSNDIALLRLGKESLSDNSLESQFSDERVDLSIFSPVCIPDFGESFLNQDGHVYGEHCQTVQVRLTLDI